MAHFLLLWDGAQGDQHALMGLAQGLLLEGAEVTWALPEAQGPRIAALGFPWRPWTRGSGGAEMLRPLLTTLRPDVALLPAALSEAIPPLKALGIPFATLALSLDPEGPAIPPPSPWLNLHFGDTPPADAPPPGAQAWRPLGPPTVPGRRGDETPYPGDRLGEGPLVYVSLGSAHGADPAPYDALIAATRPLGIQLVLSCGDLAGSAWAKGLPAGVLALAYAPQRALLARARAFISGGGPASVMEALGVGVPTVISPLHRDAEAQCRFLAEEGAGMRLDLATSQPFELTMGLAALLREDAPQRQAARRIAQRWSGGDSARVGARALLSLAAGLPGPSGSP